MPTPRAAVAELQLRSTPSNLERALKLRDKNPGEVLLKRDELEKLFADCKAEYEIAADDVRIRGSVIQVTKYTSKGKSYSTEVVNPYYRIMRGLTQQIATLARMLSKLDAPKKTEEVAPGSFAALYPDVLEGQPS
jgi:hypothetical protein